MKRIKTESGRKIAASYKSQLYKKWRERHKIDAMLTGEEEREDVEGGGWRGEVGGGRRGRGRGRGRGGRGGREGGRVNGRMVGDLKTREQILKKRKKKEYQAARREHRSKRAGPKRGRGRHK